MLACWWVVLALVLALPAAQAASAEVLFEESSGAWNVVSTTLADEGARDALVWVPADARLQRVTSDGAPASWRAAGPEALLVALAPNATRAEVAFDLRPAPHALARFVAPGDLERVVLDVRAPAGLLVASPDAPVRDGPGGASRVELVGVAAGASVVLRLQDADRVDEATLLVVVLALALLVLLLGLLYHRLRAPPEPPQRFLDHLRELQLRLAPPVVAFALANVLLFVVGVRRVEMAGMPLLAPTFDPSGSLAARAFEAFSERLVPAGVSLVVLRPVDAVLAQVQMTLFLGFVVALPLLLYELAAFVGPGLLPHERRATMRVVPLVAALFLVGAALGYLVMAPLMIATLYAYAPGLGATSLLVVGDLVSFALLLMLAFGLAFELPVVMYVLARLGIAKAATFRKYVRHAIVVIFLVAGVITPDPSVVSQTLVALPVTLLYLVGIAAARFGERAR